MQLTGAVQKGPFLLGTTVSVSPLDASGKPTGQVFLTQPTTDLGDFRVDFAVSGLVSLEAPDLDGDAFRDLVVAAESGGDGDDGGIYLLRGKAGGGFTALGRIPGVTAARRVATGDFDGDDVPDVAALLGEENQGKPIGDVQLGIFRGDGTGTFTELGRFVLGLSQDLTLPRRLTVLQRPRAVVLLPVGDTLRVFGLGEGGKVVETQRLRVLGNVDDVFSTPLTSGGLDAFVVQQTRTLADGSALRGWSTFVVK